MGYQVDPSRTSLVQLSIGLHHYLPMVEEAKCAETDPEVFFPEVPITLEKTKKAIAICKTCDVMFECLQFAMRNNISYGIWGGTLPQQRLALRRMQ